MKGIINDLIIPYTLQLFPSLNPNILKKPVRTNSKQKLLEREHSSKYSARHDTNRSIRIVKILVFAPETLLYCANSSWNSDSCLICSKIAFGFYHKPSRIVSQPRLIKILNLAQT